MQQLKSIQRFTSTTNLNDVLKFKGVRDWWSVGGSMQALWQYNYLRVQFIHEVLGVEQRQDSILNKNILDVGAGGGILSESLCRLGGTILGIDVSQQSLDTARNHQDQDPALRNNPNLKYVMSGPEELDDDIKYDIVTAMEVIEHVVNKEAFIRAISDRLQPNGLLFMSTISKTNESYLKMIVGAEYITGIVPKGTHEWELFINPDDLQQQLERVGLKVLERRGVNYDLITGRMDFSDNYTQYLIAAQKQI